MTIILLCAVPALLLFLLTLVVPRLRMGCRARALLEEHQGAERTSVYLPLHSTFAWQKRREMDAKIAEMQPQDWIFLQANEASLFKTSLSWGGGLTLHFIRDPKTGHVA